MQLLDVSCANQNCGAQSACNEENHTMTTGTAGNGTQPSTVKRLLACGIIGPLFFIIAFLIEGATRADYNPFRHPVSSLSIGELGWMQAANFIISGSLIL